MRTACQLWYAALAVGVVQLIAGLVAELSQRQELAQQMFDQLKERQPDVTLAQAQVGVAVFAVLMALFRLALCGGGIAVVYQLGRGKPWARTVLNWFAAFLGIGALLTVLGVESAAEGAATVVSGVAAILQAVLVGGGVFLCYRSESEAYFRPGPR